MGLKICRMNCLFDLESEMSYKNSIIFQPTTSKYPFLLATEADGIPLTLEELEALHSECENALRLYDESENGK